MKKKANRKMLRNVIVFLLLIVVTFWYLLKDQDMNQLWNTIKSANKGYLLLGAISMLGCYAMESYNLKSILHAFGERKISMLKALKFTLIGFFFSSITPAASGGQPVEIYYMTKEKISGAKATMTSLVLLCSFQINTIALGLICAILNSNLLKGGLIWIYLLGITMNSIILIFTWICIFSEKITNTIMNSIIKAMKKAKLKNIENKQEKILEGLGKYQESSIYIKAHKNEFVKAIGRGFIQICFYYSVPFFVYKSLGLNSHNYIQLFMMQSVLYTTVSSLPLPGAVGISETVFLKIFEPVFTKKLINASTLLNRTITFYLYIIISLIVVTTNAIKMKDITGEIDKKYQELEIE